MKLTKISLLLAFPFTLAICAGHVKADSVTTTADPATTLVATQPATDSTVPTVSATTDQNLTTPTDSENQSSDSKNESDAYIGADSAAVASDAAQSLVVPETDTATQTTKPDTAGDHTTTEQATVRAVNETSSPDLAEATAEAQTPAISDASTATQTTTSDTADDHTIVDQETVRAVNETSSSNLADATTDVSAATVTDSGSQPLASETSDAEQADDQDIIPETGTWTFYAPFYARAAAEASAEVVTTYEAGDVIDYTGTVVAGGDIWLKNQSAAGIDQYTAVLTESGGGIGTSIIPLSGNWTFHATYYGYAAADTTSEKLATYQDGDEIHYTGTKVGENKIWIEYKPTSGATQYIAVLTDAGKSIATSILPMTGSWTFYAPFYGYASASITADRLDTYHANQIIQYTGLTVAENKIWLEYQPANSAMQYIAVLTEGGAEIATSLLPLSGDWSFDDTFYGYSETATTSDVLATYQAGDKIHFTGVKVANQLIWLEYQPTTGSTEYIAVLKNTGETVPTSIIPMFGQWTFDMPCKAYSALDLAATVTKEYQIGESIDYTSIVKESNYIWLVAVVDGVTQYLPILTNDA